MTAAAELARLLEDLERAETTVMDLACGGRAPEPWTIYPDESGVFSRKTRSQFYYHVHAGARHDAGNLKRYARRFEIDERHGEPRLIRFVNLMFRVFLPEVERLQDEKANVLVAHRLARPGTNVFEDRSLEVLSRVDIDVRPLVP